MSVKCKTYPISRVDCIVFRPEINFLKRSTMHSAVNFSNHDSIEIKIINHAVKLNIHFPTSTPGPNTMETLSGYS